MYFSEQTESTEACKRAVTVHCEKIRLLSCAALQGFGGVWMARSVFEVM